MSTDCSGIAPLISASTLGFSKSRKFQRGICPLCRHQDKAKNQSIQRALNSVSYQATNLFDPIFSAPFSHSSLILCFAGKRQHWVLQLFSFFSDEFCSRVPICPMPGATTSEVAWGGGRIPTASRGRWALKPHASSCLQGGVSTCLKP